MKFNSLTYLIFLFLSFAIYWAVNKKYRLYFLLFASITFYSYWSWKFLVLICISAFVDYCFSKNIYHAHTISKKTFFLTCAISSNLILLIAFKYLNFFIENLLFIFSKLNISTSLHYVSVTIPLGISFYTFLSISYVTDVYKGITKPAGNYLKYLTYVSDWPHMIAGPILRFSELFPQLYKKSSFRLINIVAGLRLIITGLFLKVVLADQLSYFVDEAFSTPVDLVGGLDVLTMSSGFGLQIYFDFAGYSMIAIGSAKLFGINFVDNFNWPYLSVSPKDFWRRWHITLSSWVRDYLYFPLLGLSSYNNSKGGIGINRALNSSLFFSWIIMGLWHGASWNFAFWGLWHAILISLYRAFPIDSLFKNNVFTYFIRTRVHSDSNPCNLSAFDISR